MWITLTSSLVETRLTKPELTALLTAAKQSEQTAEGLMEEALGVVTREARGYVPPPRGVEGTIPDELERAVLALVREYLFTRLPGMKGLYDEIRQKEAEAARISLRDAAKGLLTVVPPETPAPDAEQVQGGAPQFCANSKRFSREDGAGL